MAIDTFLLETPFILGMHPQPKRIAALLVQYAVVVAVPAGVAGESGRRVVRIGIRAGITAMSCFIPLRGVDFSLAAV